MTSQVTTGVRSVLSLAAIYNAFQNLVGARASRRNLMQRFINPLPNQRILDIGCGTAELLEFVPPTVRYVGFDASAHYIDAAKERWEHRGTFVCSLVDESSADQWGHFDIVIAIGVLHHLEDASALALFRTAKQCLKPGGRLVTVDGAHTDSQSWMARKLIDMDRGQHIRSADAYLALSKKVFDDVELTITEELLRIPYTHAVLTATAP
jgi:cyclopropane fatty-acyl-phospholipid synthase-like methyltransferase